MANINNSIINFQAAADDIARHGLTFRSPKMQQRVGTAIRYARSSAPVLITGESGTGKALFSRLIHQHSPRADRKMVTIACASLSESQVESELLNTDGNHSGDTIVLDEISEASAAAQTKLLKLLRVIEKQSTDRLGCSRPEPTTIRIIATSNRNLEHEMAVGNFRLDLFHRLSVLHIDVPPLRQRSSDIPPLVHHFVKQFRSESNHPIHGVTAAAMHHLCQHTWPGNIRELRNTIYRACINGRSHQITDDDLQLDWATNGSKIAGTELSQTTVQSTEHPTAGKQIAEVEKSMILSAIKRHQGNKTAAAAELGVTARTLSNKMKLYQQSKAA